MHVIYKVIHITKDYVLCMQYIIGSTRGHKVQIYFVANSCEGQNYTNNWGGDIYIVMSLSYQDYVIN